MSSQPTFFLVGAPKAGTTSLFRYLAQHPGIAVSSVKEPCFFAPEVPVDAVTDAHRQSWDAYLSLFAHANGQRAIGEGSVAYLGSVNAAKAIRERIPDARILMMFRDPADRLFAHYAAARASGLITGAFAEWLAEEHRRETERSPTYGPIWAGRYHTHLARFLDHFPATQLHMTYYEDFNSDPDAVLAGIFTFLGVDASVMIDWTKRHNVTTTARWPALAPVRHSIRSMAKRLLPARAFERARGLSRQPLVLAPEAADRACAIALYRDEIRALQRATGRELGHWLVP